MMQALELLQIAKRHVLERSDIENEEHFLVTFV